MGESAGDEVVDMVVRNPYFFRNHGEGASYNHVTTFHDLDMSF